ncbi:MAG: DUF4328 domain-containing protein [Actinomycetota bacterium]
MSTGPPTFSHTGYRYVLGYLGDEYLLWDRADPSVALERFPRTTEGWTEAWRRFAALEPRAEALDREGRLGSVAPIHVVRPLRGLARATVALLIVDGLVSLTVAVSTFFEVALLGRIDRGASVSAAEALSSDRRQQVLGALSILVLIGAAGAWLTLQHRAQTNLHGMGMVGLQFTPGWAVGWWFVPLANLVMPFQTVRELRKASDPEADRYRWRLIKTPRLLGWWWAAWLIGNIGGSFGVRFGADAEVPADVLATGSTIRGAALVVVAVAAVLAALVVRDITAGQAERVRRHGDAPVLPGTDDPGPPTFTHWGAKYAIGFDGLGYAVWVRERSGDPVERFGAGDAAWGRAWGFFIELEPAPVAPSSPVPGLPPNQQAVDASGTARATLVAGIASLVTGIFFLGVVFGPVALIVGAVGYRQVRASTDPERDRRRLRTGMILGAIGLAASIVVIAIVANSP